MAIIAAAIAAVGAVANAAAAKKAQESENAQLENEARVAEANATLTRMDGELSYSSALREEQRLRYDTEMVVSDQISAYAASGVKVSSSSAMDSYFNTRFLGEQDALAVRFKGEVARWNSEQEANILDTQAGMYRSGKGDPNQAAGLALLGGAAKTYSAYKQG